MNELLWQLNLPLSTLTKEYMLSDKYKYPACAAANIKMAPEIIENLRRAYTKVFNLQDFAQPKALK